MPNESAPPIRDLPAEIEATLHALVRAANAPDHIADGDGFRHAIHIDERMIDLRHAIRAALDDQDNHLASAGHNLRAEHLLSNTRMEHLTALRERTERLRRKSLSFLGEPTWTYDDLQPGDLADNLRPPGGDER